MPRKLSYKNYREHPLIKRFHSYAHHFVCFACRKMFNKQIGDIADDYESLAAFREKFQPLCPDCQQPMLNMGIGFKPPRKSDVKAWRRAERRARRLAILAGSIVALNAIIGKTRFEIERY